MTTKVNKSSKFDKQNSLWKTRLCFDARDDDDVEENDDDQDTALNVNEEKWTSFPFQDNS